MLATQYSVSIDKNTDNDMWQWYEKRVYMIPASLGQENEQIISKGRRLKPGLKTQLILTIFGTRAHAQSDAIVALSNIQ